MTDEKNSQNPAENPGPESTKIPIEGQPAASAPGPEPAPRPSPEAPPETAGEAPKKEAGAGGGGAQEPPGTDREAEKPLREPFPFMRLLFAVLFGVIASFVFWVVVLLAFLQFVTIAIAGEKNAELQQFNRQVANYMRQMFDYMTLASDQRPFPFGPFPKE